MAETPRLGNFDTKTAADVRVAMSWRTDFLLEQIIAHPEQDMWHNSLRDHIYALRQLGILDYALEYVKASRDLTKFTILYNFTQQ